MASGKIVNGHNGAKGVSIPISGPDGQEVPPLADDGGDKAGQQAGLNKGQEGTADTTDDLAIVGREVGELASVVWDAVQLRPPAVICSIMGWPWTWLPPHDTFSEFKIVDLWRLRRTLRFLVNTTVPSLPMQAPPFGPPFLNNRFWHPSVVLQRPDHEGSYTSFPREKWFFVNGIMTDDNMAQINAAYLAFLFHRPITLIQNSTDAILVDLIQCALGKKWHHPTEPVKVAFPAIYDALTDPDKEKVVVVCHSQGTIIMADVLRLLKSITRKPAVVPSERAATRFAAPEFVYPEDAPLDLTDFAPLDESQLAKLEIYAFATCADRMTYHRAPGPGQRPIPWIEHFGNENDLVARLGMLAPQAEDHAIQIDGPRYEHPGAWGHLLNAHYLAPIHKAQRPGRKRGGLGGRAPYTLVDAAAASGSSPRLYAYLNGGRTV